MPLQLIVLYRITLDKIYKVNTNAMQTIYKINTKTMQNRHCKYVGSGTAKQGKNSPVDCF